MARTGFRSWAVYAKAFRQARIIAAWAEQWPEYEQRRLADQIIRSSRSVLSNLGESFGKRRYPKHFTAKITDASSENAETQVWLDVALDRSYITKKEYVQAIEASEEIGRLLTWMERNPGHFDK